jgi:hypothetical protein
MKVRILPGLPHGDSRKLRAVHASAKQATLKSSLSEAVLIASGEHVNMEESGDRKTGVQDALTFARSLAREEIESIERIHNRTLKYIGYIGLVVLTLGGVLGYVGYTNLKNVAVATAKAQMRKEVTDEVREKLTKNDIEQIVREQIHDYSATELNNTIHKELSKPPILVMLHEVAAKEARNQIKLQFAHRHLSEALSVALIRAVSIRHDLDGVPVTIIPAALNSEADDYAQEIAVAVQKTKLKVVADFPGYYQAKAVEGIGLYYDQSISDQHVSDLRDAFVESGIQTKIVKVNNTTSPSPKEGAHSIVIYVGARFQ